MENRVYRTVGDTIPLTPDEMLYEANLIGDFMIASDYPKRITGKGHCRCYGNGEFVLLPVDDLDVQNSQKRYMQCRKCGCWSHL